MRPLKIGVVGATGMVGKSFIEILTERKFPVAHLAPFASDASVGKTISLQSKQYPIQSLKQGCFDGLDLVFFSSGDDISREWAAQAVKAGAWAVDNSAAFRADARFHLVVPEVNGDLLEESKTPSIIANPNCSTIQLVVALKPLLENFGLEKVQVASYQAVSGAGQQAHDDLMARSRTDDCCVPEIGSFDAIGFTSEENKIMTETKKILRASSLKVSAFTVRVPVLNAHAEAVWVTLAKEVSREQVLSSLEKMPGLKLQTELKDYVTQRESSGTDPVYVGRVHQDQTDSKTWIMWVVADNIRKGAALNGIQIAERLFQAK